MYTPNHHTCRYNSSKVRKTGYTSGIEDLQRNPAGNVWADYPELHRMLSRKAYGLGDREPDDVASEAIRRALRHSESAPALRAYLSGDSLPPEWSLGRLTAFLHVTVRNIILERLRANGRLREVPIERSGEDGPASDPPSLAKNPEEHAIGRQIGSLLSDGLRRIPEKYRRALLLSAAGMSHLEISRILDCQPGTVASLISRGRKALKDHIGAALSRPRKEKD